MRFFKRETIHPRDTEVARRVPGILVDARVRLRKL